MSAQQKVKRREFSWCNLKLIHIKLRIVGHCALLLDSSLKYDTNIFFAGIRQDVDRIDDISRPLIGGGLENLSR